MSTNLYVASLDVGTTTIRCVILDKSAKICSLASCKVKLHYPKPGYVEINPNELWEQVIHVINSAICDAKLTPKDIATLGISTQRATFLTWARDTNIPFHNFVTWKDIRAKELCAELNSSLYIKAVRYASYGLYCVTRGSRFLTGSRLKISSVHVTGRLLWVLKNLPDLEMELSNKNVMFGTVETWLLYKLTKGALHVTDISNASATGFFDPFVCEWGSWAKIVLKIPEDILPQVVENDFKFGNVAEEIFGAEIPIGCVMADQSSSVFGSGCLSPGSIKATLGTGAFLDVNTGSEVHTSVTGIYPVIGWKLNNKVVYLGEAPCNDCGSFIEWLLEIGLVTNPAEILEKVTRVEDSDGVFFIPAFSGFGPPINDERASSGFLGIKATTTSNHLVRSVLEGIVFRIALAFETLKKERLQDYHKIIVDGGVSKNDFVCQMLANLTGLTVARLHSTEMSVMGVGYLAGIALGVWKSFDDLKEFRSTEKTFYPKPECLEMLHLHFWRWLNAVERFKHWYED